MKNIKEHKIVTFRFWSPRAIERYCKKKKFYTEGRREEFLLLLESAAKEKNPSSEEIFDIAYDIAIHSKKSHSCWTDEFWIAEIMKDLEHDALRTFYSVEIKESEV